MVGSGGAWGVAAVGQEKRLPTHNHAFSIASGKVADNMTIV